METAYRTHTCGALSAEHVGQTVRLCGWVDVVRDQGGVLFVDLRDRYGRTQVTFRGDIDADLLTQAERVRSEWVLQVEGVVRARPDVAVNPNMPTGEIELEVAKLVVLSEAETPPFPLDSRSTVGAEIRLKHRYLDLRRDEMSALLMGRAKIVSALRRGLEAHGLLEIETPTMVRSTPEGARDYLVPSRIHPGRFYALPQSPQLFKQLLMVGGQDRYFQFARCYRDEDLRADRQPEFTQVDLELSFANQEDVLGALEPTVIALLREYRGEIPEPLPRITWHEAMERYGSDKPDLRNPLELRTVSTEAAGMGFQVFSKVVAGGGQVRALTLPGGAALSRKDIDGFEAEAKSRGAPGLAWFKVAEDGKQSGPIARFIEGEPGAAFVSACGAEAGDLVLLAAGAASLCIRVLGHLRDVCAKRLDLVDTSKAAPLWVMDFPLVEYDEEEKRFDALHHPFTMPSDAHIDRLFAAVEAGPGAWDVDATANMCAQAYDLVIDGVEMGSGSVRVHRADVQQAIFDLLGISQEEAEARFGWFLEALRYGTPPHAGFAFGLDRFVATLLGVENIQEVIAFPKTQAATDLMCHAPADVDAEQLGVLGIELASDSSDGDPA